MQPDLFPPSGHDPGGKVRIPIKDGIVGNAILSPCGRYRPFLCRVWTGNWRPGDPLPPYALWIGMNPSTADAEVNDPTVLRELNYTRDRLRLSAYVKCNVMDYRATEPKALLSLSPGDRCSPANLDTIRIAAEMAERVIVAFGALHPRLMGHANAAMAMLADAGIATECVGYTREGFPRHPLYVRGDAPLVPYPRAAA